MFSVLIGVLASIMPVTGLKASHNYETRSRTEIGERIPDISRQTCSPKSLFACSLSVLPRTTTVPESDVGKSFVCSLWVSGIKESHRLAGWQTNVKWGPSVLRADSTKKGAFLEGHSDYIFWMSGVIDNTAGNITGFCEVLMGWTGYPELVGSGSAAIIYFTIEGKGSTPIHLDLEGTGLTYPLADKDANEIPSDMIDGYLQCGVGLDEAFIKQPLKLALFQNYPNPFSSSTCMVYGIPYGKRCNVSLKVYDLSGRLVRILVDKPQEPGMYRIQWDGKDDVEKEISSGVYFCRLSYRNSVVTSKLVILDK